MSDLVAPSGGATRGRRVSVLFAIIVLLVGAAVFAFYLAVKSPDETLSVRRWDHAEPDRLHELDAADVQAKCPTLARLFARALEEQHAATQDSGDIRDILGYLKEATRAEKGSYVARYSGQVYAIGVGGP